MLTDEMCKKCYFYQKKDGSCKKGLSTQDQIDRFNAKECSDAAQKSFFSLIPHYGTLVVINGEWKFFSSDYKDTTNKN